MTFDEKIKALNDLQLHGIPHRRRTRFMRRSSVDRDMDTAGNGKMKYAKCGYIYDSDKGGPKHGIEPGTKFDDLPDDWKCPRCKTPERF